MVCMDEVQKGEKLVSIPRKLWMTSDTAKKSSLCGRLITDQNIEPWQVRLAAELMPSLTLCTCTSLHIVMTGRWPS